MTPSFPTHASPHTKPPSPASRSEVRTFAQGRSEALFRSLFRRLAVAVVLLLAFHAANAQAKSSSGAAAGKAQGDGSGPAVEEKVGVAQGAQLQESTTAQPASQHRPGACPAPEEWDSLLRTAPRALFPCADDAGFARIYAAHAYRQTGPNTWAAQLYEAAAKEEAFEKIRAVLLISAARSWGTAQKARRGLRLLQDLQKTLSAPNAAQPPRWLQAELAAATADQAALSGEHRLAIQESERALEFSHPAVEELKLLKTRAAITLGELGAIEQALRDFRLQHPGSALAGEMEVLSKQAGHSPPLSAFSPAQLSLRWQRWIAQGGASAVAKECGGLLGRLDDEAARHPRDVASARYQCARAHYIARLPQSIALHEAAAKHPSQAPDALLGLARSHSRQQGHEAVSKACERLRAIAPRSSQSAECRYLAAYLTIQYGDRSTGMQMLREVAKDHPKHPRGQDAAWMEAMEVFSQDRAAARPLFSAIAKSAAHAELKAQALYWRGRSADSPDEARKDWEQAESLDPWGYYGWLSAIRLGHELKSGVNDSACKPTLGDSIAASPSARASHEGGWEGESRNRAIPRALGNSKDPQNSLDQENLVAQQNSKAPQSPRVPQNSRDPERKKTPGQETPEAQNLGAQNPGTQNPSEQNPSQRSSVPGDRSAPGDSSAVKDAQSEISTAADLSKVPGEAQLGALLLRAGYPRFAALDFDRILPIRQSKSLEAADFLIQAQQFQRLFLIGHYAGGERARWPVAEKDQAALRAAHPLAFPRALSESSDVNRCLLLAVMKRESHFAPEATSGAQARGLLQLLPSTASKVAEELGETLPSPESLYEPARNMRLGARYLQRLIERFDHPLVAVAAYNAGPTAVAGWLERFPGLELDEWVEKIPYRETRGYVKAVGGSFAAYSRIYGEGRPAMSLATPGARPAGIDY